MLYKKEDFGQKACQVCGKIDSFSHTRMGNNLGLTKPRYTFLSLINQRPYLLLVAASCFVCFFWAVSFSSQDGQSVPVKMDSQQCRSGWTRKDLLSNPLNNICFCSLYSKIFRLLTSLGPSKNQITKVHSRSLSTLKGLLPFLGTFHNAK